MGVLMYRCCLDAAKQLHCILSVTLGRKEQQELTTPAGVRQLGPPGCCCRQHEGVPDPSTPGRGHKIHFHKKDSSAFSSTENIPVLVFANLET